MAIRITLFFVLAGATLFGTGTASAQNSRQLPADHLTKMHIRSVTVAPRGHHSAGDASGIPGIDSLTNWNGTYKTPGFDPNGKLRTTWFYNIGRESTGARRDDQYQRSSCAGGGRFAQSGWQCVFAL